MSYCLHAMEFKDVMYMRSVRTLQMARILPFNTHLVSHVDILIELYIGIQSHVQQISVWILFRDLYVFRIGLLRNCQFITVC